MQGSDSSRTCAGGLRSHPLAVVTVVGVLLGAVRDARATSGVCVHPSGADGCASSLQEAIDSLSAPGTTILVEPGTYTASCTRPACSVATISAGAPNCSALAGLTLTCVKGEGHGRAVRLDPTGLDHAIYVSGVNQVPIEGCVAENAEREGILVEGSSNVTIRKNEVVNNDLAMAKTVGHGAPACPTFLAPGTPGTNVIQCCPGAFSGGPGNFPFDNDDCGEGLHLRSVTASVVEGNLVHDNIGGVLLTDETGPTKGNLVVGNTSRDNAKFGGAAASQSRRTSPAPPARTTRPDARSLLPVRAARSRLTGSPMAAAIVAIALEYTAPARAVVTPGFACSPPPPLWQSSVQDVESAGPFRVPGPVFILSSKRSPLGARELSRSE